MTQPSSWHAQILNFLPQALETLDPNDSIYQASQDPSTLIRRDPSMLRMKSHKMLHAYPFKEVPVSWRRMMEESCLWEIVEMAKMVSTPDDEGNEEGKDEGRMLHTAVRLCDMVIIFAGTPLRRDLVDKVLQITETRVLEVDQAQHTKDAHGKDYEAPRAKRQRLVTTLPATRYTTGLLDTSSIPNTFPTASDTQSPVIDPTLAILRTTQPSLATFETHIRTKHTPRILRDTMAHWPALERWQSPRYWLSRTHAGLRLVPVELGRCYTDAAWGQDVIGFGTYLRDHVLGPGLSDGRRGYLAQHDLLGQVPALRNDVAVPDYCFIGGQGEEGEDDESLPTDPALNVWLGPEGTISPAHTDPHENLLAQVVGRKYVRLFPPSTSSRMYPMGDEDDEGSDAIDMSNTSRVDVGAFVTYDGETDSEALERQERRQEEAERFPLHAEAPYVEAILEPGECLYIPKGWWHYIRSLEVSCSVSFWWD